MAKKLLDILRDKIRVRVKHIFCTLKISMNNALSLKDIGLNRIKSLTGLLNIT
jgi:hypothetical protein